MKAEYIKGDHYYIDGVLYHSVNKSSNRIKTGDIAGSKDNKGYLRISVDGKRCKAHRVIWEHFNGEIPDNCFIDHINGVKNDNRIENLRIATASQNAMNRQCANKNNKLGVRGVHITKSGSYRVSVSCDGKRERCSVFNNLNDAKALAEKIRILKFGEFA